MHFINKKFAAAAAVAIGLLAASGAQAQQAYPSDIIRFVTGFPAGSGADIVTRYFANKLGEKIKATVLVDNKVGASGVISMEAVARAKPDGYTFLLSTGSSVAATQYLMKNLNFDVGKSFEVAATLNRQAFMIVVDQNSPHKNMKELTAAMLAKGEKANYAVAAPSGIVLGEMYKQRAGLKATEIRFKNAADAVNEFVSGNIDYGAIDPQFALAQMREKRMRILAVGSGKRFGFIPDIPTMSESGFDMDLTGWWAILAPAGTPRPIKEKIHGWIKEIVESPETLKFLNDSGGDPFVMGLDEAQAYFIKEITAQADTMRAAKIEPQ